jgi:hypothetical protein
VIAVDPKTKRLTKYGDCYLLTIWAGIEPNRTVNEMCDAGTNFALTSQLKADSIQSKNGYKEIGPVYVILDDGYFKGTTALFTGLHRNKQKQWVWYDLDKSEFPVKIFWRT